MTKYRVKVTAVAYVTGYVTVEASSAEAAQEKVMGEEVFPPFHWSVESCPDVVGAEAFDTEHD